MLSVASNSGNFGSPYNWIIIEDRAGRVLSQSSALGGSVPTNLKNGDTGDFPGGSVVKTSPSNEEYASSILDWGAKIPHTSWAKTQNI